jgi:hypothetical protein
MALFEITITLLIVGALLAAIARRLRAPYPAFLAVAGAVLAMIPGTPSLTLSPDLVLTLFVAPSLLDAAFDASPRDLRDNWLPIAGSAVVAVVLTVPPSPAPRAGCGPTCRGPWQSCSARSSRHRTPRRPRRSCAPCDRRTASW